MRTVLVGQIQFHSFCGIFVVRIVKRVRLLCSELADPPETP